MTPLVEVAYTRRLDALNKAGAQSDAGYFLLPLDKTPSARYVARLRRRDTAAVSGSSGMSADGELLPIHPTSAPAVVHFPVSAFDW